MNKYNVDLLPERSDILISLNDDETFFNILDLLIVCEWLL